MNELINVLDAGRSCQFSVRRGMRGTLLEGICEFSRSFFFLVIKVVYSQLSKVSKKEITKTGKNKTSLTQSQITVVFSFMFIDTLNQTKPCFSQFLPFGGNIFSDIFTLKFALFFSGQWMYQDLFNLSMLLDLWMFPCCHY